MRKIIVMTLVAFAVTTSVSAADLSGAWAVSADIGGNAVAATCTFTQASAALTGTCKGDLGDSKVTGTIDGDKAKFNYDIDFSGQAFTLSYDGVVDAAGKEMKGTVTVAGAGDGMFTAKKQ